jgi:hypothetical protein
MFMLVGCRWRMADFKRQTATVSFGVTHFPTSVAQMQPAELL